MWSCCFGRLEAIVKHTFDYECGFEARVGQIQGGMFAVLVWEEEKEKREERGSEEG